MKKRNDEIKARLFSKGNIKLGHNTASWSVLYGDIEHDTPYGKVKGTCGGFCEHCGHCSGTGKLPPCYVAKSYVRRPDVVKGHARNTLAMRNDVDKCFADLDGQMSRKRKPFKWVRINQSGEIENEAQLRGWAGLAKKHKETKFWLYTKNYEVATKLLLAGEIPQNMTILYSIWHEQGIEEYKMVKHLPNVKAFCYCDSNSDPVNGWGVEEYAERGIEIKTFCKAYDVKGKMNHDITCEKCEKCFRCSKATKVVASYSH